MNRFKTGISMAAVLAGALLGTAAWGQSFRVPQSGIRAETWEFYGGLHALSGEKVDFEGGSAIDTDNNDLGFAFGGGYNFNEHLQVGGEFSWNSVDYDGDIVSADEPAGEPQRISGSFDAATISANVTWHFLARPVTPYVTGSLGYTWIDTNVATGPPVTGCWWDPWWGYICDTFVDTRTEEAATYGVGAGVRWDIENGLFLRLGYDERWLDLDNANGTPTFGVARFDFGGRF